MSESARDSWELLVGRRALRLKYDRCCLSTYNSALRFYLEAVVLCLWGMQVPGEKSNVGLALRAGVQPGGCMGTVSPADLEVTLVVIAAGVWQGF